MMLPAALVFVAVCAACVYAGWRLRGEKCKKDHPPMELV